MDISNEQHAINLGAWNGKTLQLAATIPLTAGNTTVQWSPDGSAFIAAGDEGNRLFNSKGNLIRELDPEYQISEILWSPDSKELFLASGAAVMIWTIDGKQVGTFDNSPVGLVGQSYNGQYIAGRSGQIGIGLWDKTSHLAFVVDLVLTCAQWSPTAMVIAVCSEAQSIKLWKVQ